MSESPSSAHSNGERTVKCQSKGVITLARHAGYTFMSCANRAVVTVNKTMFPGP